MFQLLPSREVAVQIRTLSIHWYGVLYAVAFVLGYYIAKRAARHTGLVLSDSQWNILANVVILGVVLGGRIGYMLLYEWNTFITAPWTMFFVWQGGMSSHGGFIAVAIALIYFARRYKVQLLPLVDTLIVPIALGLMLGRIGNVINQELYGIVTTVSWGVSIPGVEGVRHPTALYAVLKDLYLALISALLLMHYTRLKPGVITAVFLLQYSILRFLLEFIRVPTHTDIQVFAFTLTRGQLYSIPIFIGGLLLLFFIKAFKKTTTM